MSEIKCVYDITIDGRNYAIDKIETHCSNWLETTAYTEKINKLYFAFLEVKPTDAIYDLVISDNLSSVSKIQRILKFRGVDLIGRKLTQPKNDKRIYIGFSTCPPSYA